MKARFLEISKQFFWVLGLIPIFIYFNYLKVYGQNIPHWDDYAIRGFIDQFNASDSIGGKLTLIFAQHNEHRIAFTRIVALLIYKINGSLNFLWMIWIGNFALVGILILFIKVLKNNKLSSFYVIPICFLLFQLSLYENTFWAMASVQNFYVILFSLLAFYQISKDKVPYLWASMAAFTSANGVLFVPLIGLMAFLHLKSYSNLLKFALLSTILVLFYFVTYIKPPDSQAVLLNDVFQNIKAVFVNIGSFADLNTKIILENRVKITFISGILLVVFYGIYLLLKFIKAKDLSLKIKSNFLFFSAILLFVLATCAVTTLSRMQYGFYVFLVSRYKIYSVIAICSFYLMVIIYFQSNIRKYLFMVFLLLAIYLNFNTLYYTKSDIVNYRKSELASFYNGWHDKNDKIILHKVSSFQYSPTFLDKHFVTDTNIMKPILGKVLLDSNRIEIENNEFEIKGNLPEDGAYLEFSSGKKRYIFATEQELLRSKKSFLLKKGAIFGKGFNCKIPLEEIETGDYFINILEKQGESLRKIPTNYYIELEGKKPKEIIQNW
jgi:hypothetical protein